MGWPTTFVTKSLLAASSTSIGSFSSAGVMTLSCAVLDTPRRIVIAGTSGLGTAATITGLTYGNQVITESVVTSSIPGGTVQTTQDFIKVTSISLSSNPALTSSQGGIIGTSSQGGTPWFQVDTNQNPFNLMFSLTPASSQTQTSFEWTMDDPVYNPATGLWVGCAFSSRGPQPQVSSLGSSVIGPTTTNSALNTPIIAWRITFSSSGSSGTGIGGTQAGVTQLGV